MGLTSKEADKEYDELMMHLRPVFASKSGFQNAQEYIRGLIGPVERKNGWQLSEYFRRKTPYS